MSSAAVMISTLRVKILTLIWTFGFSYIYLGYLLFAAQQSKITIGIAGPDIDNDAHPGHWNNTVGYHSDTGKCFTSHIDTANTKGEKFTIGKSGQTVHVQKICLLCCCFTSTVNI